ncbi:hypothetical protein EAH89_02005 [Roseomonas nepalensis]|uniref:Toxic anion resistance protein n=1 Tax=Muricoccus nepalensis TaxID=1854500 RepID=A0A502GK31_9PROT|nr:hypothetical protein [Roseomonas nepalensis]TPG61346.1 hypothetical protein EAH89_02005 [Roseomonas nepalensis]
MSSNTSGAPAPAPLGWDERSAAALETMAYIASTPAGTGGLLAAGGSLDLARLAQQSMARVLGLSAGGDPRRALARLAEVFPETTERGESAIGYRPLGAQPVEGPAGALVAGAQAVFVQQAQDLRQGINALLDRLEPVVTDPDEEAIESLVAAYRRTLDMVVEEYGREGGGAPDRIELGAAHLGKLRGALERALGLSEAFDPDRLDLALLEKEGVGETMRMLQSQTDQLTQDLRHRYVDNVLGGVGTLFARLTWTVRAIAPSVAQARTEFDALRIDEADRLLITLNSSKTMNAELLLRWCESAAAGWTQAMAEGRRISIGLVRAEAERLAETLDALRRRVAGLPGGGRIAAALQELGEHVAAVAELAQGIEDKGSGAGTGRAAPGQRHGAPPPGGAAARAAASARPVVPARGKAGGRPPPGAGNGHPDPRVASSSSEPPAGGTTP